MKIKTNISDKVHTHDLILYPPIEKQLFDLFAVDFPAISHTVSDSGLTFDIDGHLCPVEVGKKGVKVSMLAPDIYKGGIKFGEEPYPSVKLGYNKDLDKKLSNFFATIRKIQDLEKKAKALPQPPTTMAILSFLKTELETEHVTVSYHGENIFSGIEITFYLHPKGDAPADGVVVCLEGHKIVPFWNGSTQRRTHHYGEAEGIEKAVGCMLTQDERRASKKLDLAGMKKKVAAVEAIQTKVDAFDPGKSKSFLALLDLKKKADQLVAEFKGIVND